MSMNWTKEQMQVITSRGKNLLVSAAAGSGKTAVLVERIIGRILDPVHPVEIDRMLVVTFTSAAAAEMRGRIGEAIDAALLQDPENAHLIKQASLLHHAQITTVHSFCLNLIRNYFHRVDLEPNFRIAEEGELNLLQEDVMAEVLNRNYETASEEFLHFTECFVTGKKDDVLKEMTLKLYRFAMSYPWPVQWLLKIPSAYQAGSFEELEEKEWMQSLLVYLKQVLHGLCEMAEQNLALTFEEDGPAYLTEIAENDAMRLARPAEQPDYKGIAEQLQKLTFDRLPSKRGYEGSEEKLERWKDTRGAIKETVKKLKEDFFFASEDEMLARLSGMYPAVSEMVRLTNEFMEAYDAKKREKNLLDFDDLEHFALKILIDEETKAPTETARLLRQFYEEVMIDEYQDCNLVQERLMCAVSGEENGRFNRFMVGDVKQSIYRFRLARPELFMEKYETYAAEEEDASAVCQKVELHKNFRSREEVLHFTNEIFYGIMKKDLGKIEYDASAALYPGASYEACRAMEAELILADSGDEMLKEAQMSDPVRLEAELTAARIRRLLRTQQVTDKKTGRLRPANYSDIVILLRSFSHCADTFLEVLEQKKIPAYAASKTGYFQALEIQTMLSFLRVLDNPRQDIPLAALLRSPIGGFLDEELALIKALEGRAFHCCILEPQPGTLPEALDHKLSVFLQKLSDYRDLAAELSIYELLYRLLEDTGYLRYAAAMPGGRRRRANLEMLLEQAAAYEKTSYRGLYHFIRYIDRLQKYEVDYGEADVTGENADAVRIMTIHKSKGLEFPIVFLCQTTKQFNHMDARSRMVIHPDLGAAIDYIDPVRRVRSATLFKKAAARQIDLENQGEELRVLYVAMTRTKEKLILTGAGKGIRKKVEQTALLPQRELSFFLRSGANSFLDWVLPAMAARGLSDHIQVWDTADFIEEETETQVKEAEGISELLYRASRADEAADAFVEEQLSYRYPYMAETNRKIKYSVSELKHRAAEALFEETELLERNTRKERQGAAEETVPYIPRFAGGETTISSGALRGSAMHRAVECLPIVQLAGNEHLAKELEKQIRRIVSDGHLREDMEPLLQREKLIRFYRSALALRMKQAAMNGELYRERPFVMGCTADEIDGDGSDTMVLVQGIVDAYFIEDGDIVLTDYKTDLVTDEEELVRRYQKQMQLYQKALEDNLGKRVKERLIYSFCLDRTISIAI